MRENKYVHYHGVYKKVDEEGSGTLLAVLFLLVTGLISVASYNIGKIKAIRAMTNTCTQCHNYTTQMEEYFKRSGSRAPKEMANGVIHTGKTKLMAAIAVVESNGNPHISKRGYRQHHDGAYQVNPHYWGRVPQDATGQTKQAEKILQELIEDKGSVTKGLNAYGGDVTKKRYAVAVLEELRRVP